MALHSSADRQVWPQAGLALGDDDYVRAVAGAGVYPFAGRPLRWLRWVPHNFSISRDQAGGKASVELLLKHRDQWNSWLAESEDKRITLGSEDFGPGTPELTAIARILNHPAVGAHSVLVEITAPHADVPWQWPLRISALADDFDHLRLGQLNKKEWWPSRELTTTRPLDRDHTQCEILVIRGSPLEALRRLLNLPYQARAGYLLLLGAMDWRWGSMASRVDALLAETKAAGISMAPAAPTNQAVLQWMNDFVRELSHNAPFDMALAAAFPRESSLHVMDLRLLDLAAMTTVVRKLQRRLQELPEKASVGVATETCQRLGFAMAMLPQDVLAKLESCPKELFDSEIRGATATKEIATAERTARRETGSEEAPRYLQGDLFTLGEGGEPRAEKRGLIVGARYRLEVFIGPEGKGAIVADRPVDETEIDWLHKDSYTLQVLFAEPRQWDEPMRGTMELRRVGASDKCAFLFSPTKSGPFVGRVTVYYRGRVLQTALLKTTVAKDKAEWEMLETRELSFHVEAVIRQSLGTLHERRRFDACIVLNHTSGGQSAATAASQDGAYIASLDKVEKQLPRINALLTQIANQPKQYGKGLRKKANTELLRKLAKEGNWVYRNLVVDWIDRSSAAKAIRDSTHLQVVSMEPDKVVPLEFAYTFPAPQMDAPVCPRAEQALRETDKLPEETCPKKCDMTGDPAPYVCPLGFWGLSKVIERHLYDPNLPKAAMVQHDEPVAGRDTLAVRGPSLLATSKEVSKPGCKKLLEQLQSAWNGKVTTVKKWSGWPKAVKDHKPVLIVALPHAGGKDSNLFLEINGDSIPSSSISESYVVSEAGRPIVLLLGCDTAGTGSWDTYATNITIFRQAQAALVLATVATVFGDDVASVAGTLVEGLAKAGASSHDCFGEVLLRAKREAVANSTLAALCLVAFGDADWKFS